MQHSALWPWQMCSSKGSAVCLQPAEKNLCVWLYVCIYSSACRRQDIFTHDSISKSSAYRHQFDGLCSTEDCSPGRCPHPEVPPVAHGLQETIHVCGCMYACAAVHAAGCDSTLGPITTGLIRRRAQDRCAVQHGCTDIVRRLVNLMANKQKGKLYSGCNNLYQLRA